jgi:hypothetical protein
VQVLGRALSCMRCRGGRASAQRLTVKSVPDRYAHQLECRLCWYSCGMLQQKQGRAGRCMWRQEVSERPGCAQCQPWTQRSTAHTPGAQTGGNPYCERLRRTLPFQTLCGCQAPEAAFGHGRAQWRRRSSPGTGRLDLFTPNSFKSPQDLAE